MTQICKCKVRFSFVMLLEGVQATIIFLLGQFCFFCARSEFGHIGYQGQPYPMWVQVRQMRTYFILFSVAMLLFLVAMLSFLVATLLFWVAILWLLVAILLFLMVTWLKLTSSGAWLPDHWLHRRRPPHFCLHRGSTLALDSVPPDFLSQLSPDISRYQYTSDNNGAICEGWKTLF